MSKQSFVTITTDPDNELLTQLESLQNEGYWINWVIHDVSAKGRYQAGYIACVSKLRKIDGILKK